MFAFSRDGEDLKVYGRKFPVFDNALIKKRRWREAVATARPIVYLPFTEDTLDPSFVTGGRDFLLATARRSMDELRKAHVPSLAFPGELLADVIPPEVITTLAVIEQTDDEDFLEKGKAAFDEVLSQYGPEARGKPIATAFQVRKRWDRCSSPTAAATAPMRSSCANAAVRSSTPASSAARPICRTP